MAHTYQTQDELANLFARNLSLQQAAPIQEPSQPPLHETPAHHTEIKYSISQHYHHSSHVRPTPPTPAPTDDHTIAIILSRHGVDPSTLFPSQVELFRSADSGQQMRLVELWRISPQNYGGRALTQSMDTTYPDTSYEMEEYMAIERYQKQQQQTADEHERQERERRAEVEGQGQESAMQDDLMSEGEQSNAPLTPIQGGDSRWFSPPEPYMESGYEQLARREYEASQKEQARDSSSLFGTGVGGYTRASDPVYANMGSMGGVASAWQVPTREEERLAMAQQYGQFAEHRHGQDQDEEML